MFEKVNNIFVRMFQDENYTDSNEGLAEGSIVVSASKYILDVLKTCKEIHLDLYSSPEKLMQNKNLSNVTVAYSQFALYIIFYGQKHKRTDYDHLLNKYNLNPNEAIIPVISSVLNMRDEVRSADFDTRIYKVIDKIKKQWADNSGNIVAKAEATVEYCKQNDINPICLLEFFNNLEKNRNWDNL